MILRVSPDKSKSALMVVKQLYLDHSDSSLKMVELPKCFFHMVDVTLMLVLYAYFTEAVDLHRVS